MEGGPIVEKESARRRRTPSRATRRIKEECEAELCVAEAIPSLCVEAAVKALSIVCEEGQHHQDDEHRRRRRCMWSTTPSSATSDALVSSNTDIV